jgi:trk system potassium uptake protein TrkA
MRIIIVGAGDTGWSLLSSLREQGGDDIAVIDTDETRCDQLAKEFDALVLHGDGSEPALLDKAKIQEADALVATTGSDALNTVVAMLGRQSGVAKVVVKLEGPGLRAACQEIGVDRIVSPALSAAAEIHGTLRGVHQLDFSMAARGDLRLAEIESGKAAGCSIEDLDLPEKTLVVAVLKDDEPVFPSPGVEIEEHDRLLVLGAGEKRLDELRERLRGEEHGE